VIGKSLRGGKLHNNDAHIIARQQIVDGALDNALRSLQARFKDNCKH
jgi:hypothetical protein